MSRADADRERTPSTADEEAFVVDERTLTIDGLPLHIWCRTPGNLAKVRALVERGADVNAVDEHDATPVYYCALTGNAPVLRFLLEAGAVLDPKTFVGERVLYAALTPEIKRLLLQYREQTLPRYTDALTEHLRSALDSNTDHAAAVVADPDADIGFRLTKTRCLWAHRVVLAARCHLFEKILQERISSSKVLRVRHTDPDAFEAFIRYLYTSTVSVRFRHASEFVGLVRRFQLGELEHEVERQRQWLMRKRERKYEAITHQRLEDLHIRLFGASRVRHLEQDLERYLSRPGGMSFVDVHVRLEYASRTGGEEYAPVVFPAHWIFLRRSEYFRALRSFYGNRLDSSCMVRVPSDISPFAFECVLHHMYCSNLPRDWYERAVSGVCAAACMDKRGTDRPDPNELLVEVIAAADLLGYPHVKQSAASAMEIDRENVFGLLFAAACYQSRALRAACVRVLAEMLLDCVRPLHLPSSTALTCSATGVPEPESIAASLFPRMRPRPGSVATSLPAALAPRASLTEPTISNDARESPWPQAGSSGRAPTQVDASILSVDHHAVIFQHTSTFTALKQALRSDTFSDIMEDIREEALRLGLSHKFTAALRDPLGETLDRIIFDVTGGLRLSEGRVRRCPNQSCIGGSSATT
ncbi:hypothetical protein CCYA_CCYA05G1591 [Cyanidiococcus yangmingshanensis]|nr:hypothetical protein CCYA_CCYA05G1591 [Cyanidiococcus yangmingshanensis]